MTEAQQATMLRTAYAQWETYPWAGPMFWFAYQDINTGSRRITNNFGLVRSDGTAKPALSAFTSAAKRAGSPVKPDVRAVGPNFRFVRSRSATFSLADRLPVRVREGPRDCVSPGRRIDTCTARAAARHARRLVGSSSRREGGLEEPLRAPPARR